MTLGTVRESNHLRPIYLNTGVAWLSGKSQRDGRSLLTQPPPTLAMAALPAPWPWNPTDIATRTMGTTTTGTRMMGTRKRIGRCPVVCASEQNANPSNSIFQESGNKRRASRTAVSVVQRIERAQQQSEMRALTKTSTKLYPRALLESLDERIKQNHWEAAIRVCWSRPRLLTFLCVH